MCIRDSCDIETQRLQGERKQASRRIGDLVREGVPVEEAKVRAGKELELSLIHISEPTRPY